MSRDRCQLPSHRASLVYVFIAKIPAAVRQLAKGNSILRQLSCHARFLRNNGRSNDGRGVIRPRQNICNVGWLYFFYDMRRLIAGITIHKGARGID